jgi:hypothetical protein
MLLLWPDFSNENLQTTENNNYRISDIIALSYLHVDLRDFLLTEDLVNYYNKPHVIDHWSRRTLCMFSVNARDDFKILIYCNLGLWIELDYRSISSPRGLFSPRLKERFKNGLGHSRCTSKVFFWFKYGLTGEHRRLFKGLNLHPLTSESAYDALGIDSIHPVHSPGWSK